HARAIRSPCRICGRRTVRPRPAPPRHASLRALRTYRRAAPAAGLYRHRGASGFTDGLEPLAVDAHHRSHGHEGFGVDRLHELEDHRGLALAADHHHDLRLLFGVPPLRVDERHAAVDIVDDGLRHLLIVVRDDEYLARLLVPGHDHVDRIAEDRGHHVAVDH